MKNAYSNFTVFALTLLLCLGYQASRAQGFSLPKGYTILKNDDNKPLQIQRDFNADGKADIFALVTSKDGTRFLAQLTPDNKPVLSQPIEFERGSIKVTNNLIIITNSTWMRTVPTYKFRYEKDKASFRLIGFDTESYGNAVGEGSGKASFNLLTGKYESAYNYFDRKKNKPMPYPKTKAAFTLESIYLLNFGQKVIDTLMGIDEKKAPKGVY